MVSLTGRMATPLSHFLRVSALLAAMALMGVMATTSGAAEEEATRSVSADGSGNRANGDSWSLSISSDGHFVAFASEASNLVANHTNASQDIFVRDLQAGTTELVSVSDSTKP